MRMKQNKFNATKLMTDDGKFDSKKELKRWNELKLLEAAGHISALKRQVPYVVAPSSDKYRNIKIVIDFQYMDKSGNMCFEDVKGLKKGSAYMLYTVKKKLFYLTYHTDIIEI